jgi:thioredoxin 1
MNRTVRIVLIATVLLAAIGVLIAKFATSESSDTAADNRTAPVVADTQPARNQPTLLEFGGGTCPPCKMMQEVLEELRQQVGRQLQIVEVNIHDDVMMKHKYEIRMIPTIVILSADDEEQFRHEGPMTSAELLNTFSELGYDLNASP